MRSLKILSLITLIAGCSVVATNRLDNIYGRPNAARYDTHSTSPAARAAWEKTNTVLETRCVVCHACYDAPCQLKLTSYDGVTRGASKDQVYAMRLLAASPTRLNIDAHSDAAWRQKRFYPVLNERMDSEAANREGSVMHRLLDLKRAQPLETGILPATYDFSLNRKQECPTIEELPKVEAEHPQLGMPYGMPPLTETEYRTLSNWITSGAPYAPAPALPASFTKRVNAWEAFLNGNSLKEQLMARYIYEHWYLAHLYFGDLPTGEFFDLVRSTTPPGTPIDIIPSVSPYDNPGVVRVYYRLRRVGETIVDKTHMPYRLDTARMDRLRTLFLEPEYTVTALPSYDPAVAANPFVAFRELPVSARYRLMLEESQYTIMGFIKGPVCRGQVALNVINDHFWVAFVDPEVAANEMGSEELAQALTEMRIPSESDTHLPLAKWRQYSKGETRFLKAKTAAINAKFGRDNQIKLDKLWDGDGSNQNAALTIFRHFDSATVVQGLVGAEPQTGWIISYPLLERIHYLLVAGYDVFSNTSHQVTTRMYMDFLRMEGESNLLAFLPLASRDSVRDQWYRGVGNHVKEYLQGSKSSFDHETGVRYKTDKPLPELYGLLKKHLAPVLSHRHDLTTTGLPKAARYSLMALSRAQGLAVSHLPELSFLSVKLAGGKTRQYTVIHNDAHMNISTMFNETKNRVPAEDNITLVDGFLGSYPNVFLEVAAADLPKLVDAVLSLSSESDYAALLTNYGIRRSDSRFWPHSDALHAAYRASEPIAAGVFDYGRYENR